MDVHTKEQRRRNMQAIHSRNTKIEMLLGKALWAKGIRYRKNDRSVFGTPDFTIKKLRIAIFCDSEFFHGYEWLDNQKRIKSNQEFWISKIESNIRRDELVNETLKHTGWIVVRFWGHEIKKELNQCVETVLLNIEARK